MFFTSSSGPSLEDALIIPALYFDSPFDIEFNLSSTASRFVLPKQCYFFFVNVWSVVIGLTDFELPSDDIVVILRSSLSAIFAFFLDAPLRCHGNNNGAIYIL